MAISADGLTATFNGSGAVAVKSNVAVTAQAAELYYFEATRSGFTSVGFGVSGAPPDMPTISGGSWVATADALVVDAWLTMGADLAGAAELAAAGDASTVGFVVDYRQKYPVVSIIGRAGNNPGLCTGLAADEVCVYRRAQLVRTTGALSIFAFGKGDNLAGTSVSINAGANLASKPYVYSMAGVHRALRNARFEGAQGLNMQWPASVGAAAGPTITPLTFDRAVVRQGDSSATRRGFAVASSASSGSAVRWTDESNAGALLGTGDVLNLSTDALNAISVGDHRVVAAITDASTGRYTDRVFTLSVISSVADSDDDGDGLSYDQEKLLGTDPGKPDSDGDGLADGAETALGMDPLKVDTNGNGVPDGFKFAGTAGQPTVGRLVREAGTSSGVVLSNDGLRAAFTGDLNQDCVQKLAPYADPIYSVDICSKRAVRANVGVRAGEFRYFETRRLAGRDNMGHGVTSRAAQIDPFCCFTPGLLHPLTPPSMQFNSVLTLGMINLVSQPADTMNGADADQTLTYGFVVDYRSGTNPDIFMVMRNATGQMVLTRKFAATGFNGADVVPYVYGHPLSDLEPRAEMNLGMRRFDYAPADVKAALAAAGVSMTGFSPGVGVQRWAVPALP